MKTRGIALVAALAALQAGASPSPLQNENSVAWSRSWEEAKAEALERNVPIFFTVQQDENPGCKQMEGAFRDGSFISASRRIVCVVANPDTKHGVREVMINKKKVPFCRAYDGMTCDVHMSCQSALSNFVKKGDFEIPTQYWCRPDGTELFKFTGPQGSGVQNAAALINDMERALDRISGPKMNRRDWEELKKLMREGDENAGKQNHKLALACFKRVMECKYERFAGMGKERYENYIKGAESLVSRAVKQYEKSPKDSKDSKEAKQVVQKIAKEMKGTAAGEAADKALKEIMK